MTRQERKMRRAELDAQARASFERMFPGILQQLDDLTSLTSGPKRGGRLCRPQAEYDAAIYRLGGNLTIDPDVQEANIASVADHTFYQKGGMSA